MTDRYLERAQDVAHVGHVELLVTKPEESLRFFEMVLGMEVAHRDGRSVYLRGWRDYECACLKLTEARQTGVGHIGFRAMSPTALDRRAAILQANGGRGRWVDGDYGHGPAFRFSDPDGHLLELYYESHRYEAPAALRPALKNQPQRHPGRGVAVERLDHINLLCVNVKDNRIFMQDALGCRLTEQIILDDGTEAGAWLRVTAKSYDLTYTADATKTPGRLHHVSFAVETREDVLRAADIYLDHGVFIEAGPAKHAIAQTFFLYAYEPSGNRIEISSGQQLIFDPDYRPVVWTQAERARGQAWGTPTVASFHTYGTPVVETAG
jgi:catechol 2,3-dioxygenase